MNDPTTLVLTETGVEHLPDGSIAVNVGPIVRALEFLTEGRGRDRGTDEEGNPLPDLMSLAFAVVESIVLGGRRADYFRQVKRDLDAQDAAAFGSSLALARQARRVLPKANATSLDFAAHALEGLLVELRGLSLEDSAAAEMARALEAFRSFGADRWVSATAQLLVAARALGLVPEPGPRRKAGGGVTKRSARAAKPSAARGVKTKTRSPRGGVPEADPSRRRAAKAEPPEPPRRRAAKGRPRRAASAEPARGRTTQSSGKRKAPKRARKA